MWLSDRWLFTILGRLKQSAKRSMIIQSLTGLLFVQLNIQSLLLKKNKVGMSMTIGIVCIGQLTTINQKECVNLTQNVVKYHRTISSYINDLIGAGFSIRAVKEHMPSDEMLMSVHEVKDVNQRPMFLMILAEKEIASSKK
jgi:hypothetical protein